MSESINAVSPSPLYTGVSVVSNENNGRKTEKSPVEGKVAQPVDVSAADVEAAARSVEQVVKSATDISLSFSMEEDLSRLVVAVRAVGSDKIIRQFPPEEFITVAKFIASQDPGMVNEDFLKGVLFDQYT